jgi:hypothetical protein
LRLLVAGRRLVFRDEAGGTRRVRGVRLVVGRPPALLHDSSEALDEQGHLAHQPAKDVEAQQGDSQSQAETHLGLSLSDDAQAMERPDEDQERHDRRHGEHRGRRLLK